MTSLKQSNISFSSTPVEIRHRQNQPAPSSSLPSQSDISIIQYAPALESVTGPNPAHALLFSSAKALFHSGCVYLASRNELWTTSAPLPATDPTRPATILMSRVKVTSGTTLTAEWTKLRPPPEMPMPAGGCTNGDGVVWCSQGTMQPGTGGVFYMPAGNKPRAVTKSYYGRDFNSPHSAAVSGSGVWFTDPCCGHEMDFRTGPQLPPSVYLCDTKTGEVRAVADGFTRPTGVAIDEESATLYVADSGGVKADGGLDLAQPRSIYAFDIVERAGSTFLANKRAFALPRRGAPMHIMCESNKVWAACGDGIEIWDSGGSLLGVIKVASGTLNFCRGPEDTVFVCSGRKLWMLRLSGGATGKASPELI